MQAQEVLKKYVDKYRAVLLLHSKCNLNCEECHDILQFDCWATNINKIAQEFPADFIKLIPVMSTYTLARFLSGIGEGRTDTLMATSREILIKQVLDKLKPEEMTMKGIQESSDIKGSFEVPLSLWYSAPFKEYGHLMRLLLLEIMATSAKVGSDVITLNYQYLTERYNGATMQTISACLGHLETCGFIRKLKEPTNYRVLYEQFSKFKD
jgi:hypothetical protein